MNKAKQIIVLLAVIIIAASFLSCTKKIRVELSQYRAMQLEISQFKSYYIATEAYLDEISETTDICSGSDVNDAYLNARDDVADYIDFEN